MRPRTITVDISRGADYALADYRRQGSSFYRFNHLMRLHHKAMEEWARAYTARWVRTLGGSR